ncbi:hypothetical protein GOB46_08700 [Sinorhizobium meliloti]|uniref:hypothetical protein n=1 Tax=Rhizobium meliloti TaxID=382 RepID=UPI000FD51611|nr:hypothetical protein [Sinorhizobium meliloti]MDW9415100.1 hypothetical protein [Sinorhizobium meliloti]MDW9479973.1 hypothetical protein [Sinorhizobium meliloti]MDW9510040.1 hypothetical protein [Sinorhizobium meliloti]MDW9634619.1 hypothetical protein [Sinorhizobium meliloti]MDW9810643.1 hypothetical protein [Sinorhizobium meliloti]
MRYAVLNAVRVILGYAAMLVFSAWAYQRHFTFSLGALFSLLYVFAFVPLPRVCLWRRILYITAAAVPMMIVPIVHSLISYRIDSLGVLWEGVEIVFLVGLFGPQYAAFLLSYVVLEFLIIRRFVSKRTAIA